MEEIFLDKRDNYCLSMQLCTAKVIRVYTKTIFVATEFFKSVLLATESPEINNLLIELII